jgi:hypothetical protein
VVLDTIVYFLGTTGIVDALMEPKLAPIINTAGTKCSSGLVLFIGYEKLRNGKNGGFL